MSIYRTDENTLNQVTRIADTATSQYANEVLIHNTTGSLYSAVDELEATASQVAANIQTGFSQLQALVDTLEPTASAIASLVDTIEPTASVLAASMQLLNSTASIIASLVDTLEPTASQIAYLLDSLEPTASQIAADLSLLDTTASVMAAALESLNSTSSDIAGHLDDLEPTASQIAADLSILNTTASVIAASVNDIEPTISVVAAAIASLNTTTSAVAGEVESGFSLLQSLVDGLEGASASVYATTKTVADYAPTLYEIAKRLNGFDTVMTLTRTGGYLTRIDLLVSGISMYRLIARDGSNYIGGIGGWTF